MDNKGNCKWTGQIGGRFDLQNRPTDLHLDGYGNLYLVGKFEYEMDFDPGEGVFQGNGLLNSGFIVKMKESGEFITAGTFSGRDTFDNHIYVNSITSHNGAVLAAGALFGKVDLNPGIDDLFVIAPNGWLDRSKPFINKFNFCSISDTGYSRIESCNPIWSPGNNEYWNESGVYSDLIGSSKGCDSLVFIDLTILPTDTPDIYRFGDTLFTNPVYINYMWYKDDSIQLPSTQPILSISGNGSYTLAIENEEGCIWWSEAFVVTDIDESFSMDHVSISPNPFINELTILNENYQSDELNLFIYDLNGELVFQKKSVENQIQLQLQDFETGIYQLIISGGNQRKKIKLLKLN
jgi:hypothetical protein